MAADSEVRSAESSQTEECRASNYANKVGQKTKAQKKINGLIIITHQALVTGEHLLSAFSDWRIEYDP